MGLRWAISRTYDVAVINARSWLEREDADEEFIHQFRVALRRCRVFERELGGVLPRPIRAALREPLRELFRASGPLRDLHALETSDDPALAAIRAASSPKARLALESAAVRRFEAAFRSEAAARLGETIRLLPFEEERGDARSFSELLDARIARRLDRTRRAAAELSAESPVADFHALRRSAKKLRYLIDLLPRRGSKGGARLRSETARLQKVLGALQDLVVAEELARELDVELGDVREATQKALAKALDAAARFAERA